MAMAIALTKVADPGKVGSPAPYPAILAVRTRNVVKIKAMAPAIAKVMAMAVAIIKAMVSAMAMPMAMPIPKAMAMAMVMVMAMAKLMAMPIMEAKSLRPAIASAMAMNPAMEKNELNPWRWIMIKTTITTIKALQSAT